MARPWHPIPIHDNGEPLVAIPPALLRWQPHPYQALGAPYSAGVIRFSCARAWWNVLHCATGCMIKPSLSNC